MHDSNISFKRRVHMFTLRFVKFISISLMMLFSLSACGNSEPSMSDLKKQILPSVVNCPGLTIQNFQKLNGYPQSDGSYIEIVQYDVVFKPPSKVLKYVKDWNNSKEKLLKEGYGFATNKNEISTIKDSIDAISNAYDNCGNTTNISDSVCIQQFYSGLFIMDLGYNTPETKQFINKAIQLDIKASIIYTKDISGILQIIKNDENKLIFPLNESDTNDIASYTKTYTTEWGNTVKFIRSDNGWVVANQ